MTELEAIDLIAALLHHMTSDEPAETKQLAVHLELAAALGNLGPPAEPTAAERAYLGLFERTVALSIELADRAALEAGPPATRAAILASTFDSMRSKLDGPT